MFVCILALIMTMFTCASVRRYACRIKRIGYREEVVAGMKEELVELLQLFRQRNNGAKPESIIIYRDGVSQGEFKEVRTRQFGPVLTWSLQSHAIVTAVDLSVQQEMTADLPVVFFELIPSEQPLRSAQLR